MYTSGLHLLPLTKGFQKVSSNMALGHLLPEERINAVDVGHVLKHYRRPLEAVPAFSE